jgi:hypothetical protein
MCAFLTLSRQKPGFPLQSFLPQAAKKDFRCNPLRAHGLTMACNLLTVIIFV